MPLTRRVAKGKIIGCFVSLFLVSRSVMAPCMNHHVSGPVVRTSQTLCGLVVSSASATPQRAL